MRGVSEPFRPPLPELCRTLELVAAPLLLVAADESPSIPPRVLWANGASRTLFGAQRLGSLPVDAADLFGGAGARDLGRALQPGAEPPPLAVDCLVSAGRHRLSLAARAVDAAPGHWLLTLSEAGPPPAGEWRQDLLEIMDLLPVGVEIYDADLNALFYNRFSDRLFDYEERQVLHYDEWWALGFPDPEERAAARRAWQDRVAAARAGPGSTQRVEYRVRCRDDRIRHVEFRFRFVGERLVLILLDVTDQRRLEAELRRLAGQDALTGLANRRGFAAAAEPLFAASAADGASLSLLMLDIDRFKAINDRHGHQAGDSVLAEVAARIRACLRAEDVAARLGGEEFAIALPGLKQPAAMAVAERIRRAVAAAPVETAAGPVPVTASLGVAQRTAADDGLQALLQRTDRALYAAKAAGRNRSLAAPEPKAARPGPDG